MRTVSTVGSSAILVANNEFVPKIPRRLVNPVPTHNDNYPGRTIAHLSALSDLPCANPTNLNWQLVWTISGLLPYHYYH